MPVNEALGEEKERAKEVERLEAIWKQRLREIDVEVGKRVSRMTDAFEASWNKTMSWVRREAEESWIRAKNLNESLESIVRRLRRRAVASYVRRRCFGTERFGRW